MSRDRFVQIVQHLPLAQAQRLHHRQHTLHEAAPRLTLTRVLHIQRSP